MIDNRIEQSIDLNCCPDFDLLEWFSMVAKIKQRIKQLGWVVFLFFLIKGLLWIIVPIAVVYFGWEFGFRDAAE